ncbi:MAG: hypothetical protein JWP84_3735 [Tardiphaga sp.]|nr:hypothetical protein [Tardiphaga sp.]
MTAISSSTNSQSALAQAQAKLAADQAAKASEDIIKTDQAAVTAATAQSSSNVLDVLA